MVELKQALRMARDVAEENNIELKDGFPFPAQTESRWVIELAASDSWEKMILVFIDKETGAVELGERELVVRT